MTASKYTVCTKEIQLVLSISLGWEYIRDQVVQTYFHCTSQSNMKYLLSFFFIAALCPIGKVYSASIPGVKIHGNWCGPKHGSGTPIDALDKICMVHDRCYDRYGYFNCKCDMNMVNSIAKLRSIRLRLIGAPMAAWFKNSPCKGPGRVLRWCGWRPCFKCGNVWIALFLKKSVGYKS